jgi:hypothetical protein
VTTGGVPWVMAEYVYKGLRYRAYTGLKRISVAQSVPSGNDSPTHATATQQTEAYYGPGTYYAQHLQSVPANTSLEVYEGENGFLLCDYYLNDTLACCIYRFDHSTTFSLHDYAPFWLCVHSISDSWVIGFKCLSLLR